MRTRVWLRSFSTASADGKPRAASGRWAMVAWLLVCAPTSAAVVTVTGVPDTVAVDGEVSLRGALGSIERQSDMNADVTAVRTGVYGEDDEVRFLIGGAPHVLPLTSPLPLLLRPVRIDASTESHAAGFPPITSSPS